MILIVHHKYSLIFLDSVHDTMVDTWSQDMNVLGQLITTMIHCQS